MSVVTEPGAEVSRRASDLDDDPEIPRGRGLYWVVIGSCVIVVVSIVLLLVVQPGTKPASGNQPGSLCYDSAMQMQMPCSTSS